MVYSVAYPAPLSPLGQYYRFFTTSSSDNGLSWRPSTEVPPLSRWEMASPIEDLDSRLGVTVMMSYLCYDTSSAGGTSDIDACVVRSGDGGVTWGIPYVVSGRNDFGQDKDTFIRYCPLNPSTSSLTLTLNPSFHSLPPLSRPEP
jgi:hypothetical protein